MRILRVCATFVLVAHCAFAEAQVSGPYYFDCDVPAARFSLWTGTLSSRTVEVRGSIELKESRKGRRWASLATVALTGDDLAQTVGLQLAVSPDEPDELMVVTQDNRRSAPPDVLATRPWQGQVFDFVLTLRETGELEVSVLGESRVIALAGFTPSKLALACSGAWFEFSDLVVSPR